jgi:hypothetical protein
VVGAASYHGFRRTDQLFSVWQSWQALWPVTKKEKFSSVSLVNITYHQISGGLNQTAQNSSPSQACALYLCMNNLDNLSFFYDIRAIASCHYLPTQAKGKQH